MVIFQGEFQCTSGGIFQGEFQCTLGGISGRISVYFRGNFSENFSVLYGVEQKKVMTKEIIFYVSTSPLKPKVLLLIVKPLPKIYRLSVNKG